MLDFPRVPVTDLPFVVPELSLDLEDAAADGAGAAAAAEGAAAACSAAGVDAQDGTFPIGVPLMSRPKLAQSVFDVAATVAAYANVVDVLASSSICSSLLVDVMAAGAGAVAELRVGISQ